MGDIPSTWFLVHPTTRSDHKLEVSRLVCGRSRCSLLKAGDSLQRPCNSRNARFRITFGLKPIWRWSNRIRIHAASSGCSDMLLPHLPSPGTNEHGDWFHRSNRQCRCGIRVRWYYQLLLHCALHWVGLGTIFNPPIKSSHGLINGRIVLGSAPLPSITV